MEFHDESDLLATDNARLPNTKEYFFQTDYSFVVTLLAFEYKGMF